MTEETGTLKEWLWPLSFVVCAAWVVWHLPAYILTFAPHENESMFGKVSALHTSKDVWALPEVVGFIDPVDLATLIALPILMYFGIRNVRIAQNEFQDWRPIDKIAIYLGRVTMMLILLMTLVMLYEVFLRYFFDAPTLWANELTLWIGGFVFLTSGVYAMQQRCHIRIFLLYDICPRWLQRTFDTTWTALFCIFAFFLVYGSYKQIFITKFYNWEMFGTAFDPPIPATIQPYIIITIVLVALQAVVNLISDWNKEPEAHTAADDIDADELAAIKKSLGQD